MRTALAPYGVALYEFGDVGPVQHFRDGLIAEWTAPLSAIGASERGP